MDCPDLLDRFNESLNLTRTKNDALIMCLEEGDLELERQGRSLPPQLDSIFLRIRDAVSECVRPNQNCYRELEGLMKIIESRLTEVRAQEKHNEKQIMTLERERRELKAQAIQNEEQRRLLAQDKERLEEKIDSQRAELLARAERLSVMAQAIDEGPECADTAIIKESEKAKLRAELAVMKKQEEIKGLETMCERYQEEIKRVRDDCKEAIKVSENQAIEACKRMKQMNVELVKSQETARQMQQIVVSEKERSKELKACLDHERLQPLGKHLQSALGGETVEGNLATIPGLSRALILRAAKAGNVPTALRVEELLKRNEALTKELERTGEQLRTVQREHTTLQNQTKDFSTRLNQATMQASTLRQARDDAVQKLKRAQQNYELLNKSLTKQAAGWVQDRLDERAVEDARRFQRILPVAAAPPTTA